MDLRVEYPIGTLVFGRYVDTSPRFFKVIGHTPQKVRLIRIKCNCDYKSAKASNKEIFKSFLAIRKEHGLYGNGFHLRVYQENTDTDTLLFI